MSAAAPALPLREIPPGPPIGMEEFLRLFPWSEAQRAGGEPLEWLWHYDYQAPLERVWPFIVDTSRLNRAMGFPEMEFEEREGLLFGAGQYWGNRLEWQEWPWDWAFGRYFVCIREYSKGFARWLRGIGLIQPLEGGSFRLYTYFGWIATDEVWHKFLADAFPQMERIYHKALVRIERHLNDPNDPPYRTAPPQLAEEPLQRIRAVEERLMKLGISADLAIRLTDLVRKADDLDIYRIRVLPLARHWNVNERALLVAALYATREGLLTLSWDVLCPHCRGVRVEARRLGDIPARSRCEVCEIEFATDAENAVEITFHVHPSVRPVPKLFFCSAEPAFRAHIRLQQKLEPGAAATVRPVLAPGRYRLRLQGQKSYSHLAVEADRPGRAVEWPSNNAPGELRTGPELELRLSNPDKAAHVFILEQTAWAEDALAPARVFNLQDFHDLFAEEYLALDTALDIGEAVIMFVDVVGSTALFRDRGDAKAFVIMQNLFTHVHETARANDGTVIKTIGDAVMLSFNTPLDALKAAVALQNPRRVDPIAGIRVPLRISINTGPCIAVNFNRGIDYFGRTVIAASRLQRQAGDGQVVFTRALLERPNVVFWLSQQGLSPEMIDVTLPELGGTIGAARVRVS